MKIVFSRKGFDSGTGGFPSPIIDGRPISLPIPAKDEDNIRSVTTYGDLGLGEIVERVTKERVSRSSLCHYDPMFEGGRCAFGPGTKSAQGHLRNSGVAVGDVFLFFGLFSEEDGRDKHHRFFGYLEVGSVKALGAKPSAADQPKGFSIRHPHTIGDWRANNTLYTGKGCLALATPPELRLSRVGKPLSCWRVPTWLRTAGLTFHGNPDRWIGDETLNVVGRGQEFVSDISKVPEAMAWLEHIKSTIREGADLGIASTSGLRSPAMGGN